MDVLDDILNTLDLRGALYFRTDFTPPWAVTVPDLGAAARFHLVVKGACHVGFDAGATAELEAGDLVLIPRGRPHVLADRPGREAPPLERVLETAGYDGSGVLVMGGGDAAARTRMVCGHFSFRPGADHPLLRALPDHLVIKAAMRAEEPWLDEALRLVVDKVFAVELGSLAAATRLSEIVFIELLRVGIRQSPSLAAILEGLNDRQIGRALELIHLRPDEPWTVERLASAVGMSRSRFAERFQTLMGTGPMAYLGEWRLQKALALLADPRGTVQEVATRCGYQSPAAFTRAFAGKFGLPPSVYRRTHA